MTRFSPPFLSILALLALTGCVSLPDLGPESDHAAASDYPVLLPMSELLAEAGPGTADATGEDTAQGLAARAAALKARATAIRPAD